MDNCRNFFLTWEHVYISEALSELSELIQGLEEVQLNQYSAEIVLLAPTENCLQCTSLCPKLSYNPRVVEDYIVWLCQGHSGPG